MSSMPEPGANGHNYSTREIRDWDPVNMAGLAVTHGRIGPVAWAIFEHGTGHVLSIEAMNGNRTTIHIDTPRERDGATELSAAIDDLLGRQARPAPKEKP